jgi:hypothetical protein
MADYPPDGWDVLSGVTWGTDIDKNTSVVMFGNVSVEMKNTATASVGLGSDYIPIPNSTGIRGNVWLRVTNVTTAMHARLQFYNSAKTYLSSGVIMNGTLSAANTWEQFTYIGNTPSTAAFVRLLFDRTTASRTAYCAWIGYELLPVSFRAYRGATQSMSNATWTKVSLNTENYDYGGNFNTGLNRFVAPYDGIYHFSGLVGIDTVTSGYLIAALYKNGTAVARGARIYQSNAYIEAPVSSDLSLAAGDYVELYGYHNDGATRTIQSGSIYNYLSGHEIRGPR